MAADPAANYIVRDLHGVSGLTVGTGKIWLSIRPEDDWLPWVRYTLAHEYHHSAWTAKYYDRANVQDLLGYLVFEGKADNFAHLVYPNFDVPWDHALTKEQETEAWQKMAAQLGSTDFRVKRTMMFGVMGCHRSPDIRSDSTSSQVTGKGIRHRPFRNGPPLTPHGC